MNHGKVMRRRRPRETAGGGAAHEAGYSKKVKESGSDHLRGKNQEGQLRALNYKDPKGKPKSGELTKQGRKLGGHYH